MIRTIPFLEDVDAAVAAPHLPAADEHSVLGLAELLLKDRNRADELLRDDSRQAELIPRFLVIALTSSMRLNIAGPDSNATAFLAGVAAGVAVLVAAAIVRHQRNAYRRAALQELATADAGAISAILKRTALAAFPREQVASLSGAEWLAFLDRTGGTRFAASDLEALTYGGAGDGVALAAEARRWI